jgi:hypothetical protein
MRQRPAKTPRLTRPEPEALPEPEQEGTDNNDCDDSTQLLDRRCLRIPNKCRMEERLASKLVTDVTDLEWCHEHVAFCCAVCRCSDPMEDAFIISSDLSVVAHRKCCHGVPDSDDEKVTKEWAAPNEAAAAKGVEMLLSGELREPNQLEWVTEKEIYDAYKTGCAQESELHNADSDVSKYSVQFFL